MLTSKEKDAIRDSYNAIIAARGLTPRWGQRQMIAEVAKTLARARAPGAGDSGDSQASLTDTPGGSPIAVIEAGTGTGKTIAYVIPALVMARALGKRLVIATATVALQEQLIHKDLPDIRAGSGLEFDFVLAKGRRRYLCLSQLDRILAQESGGGRTIGLYPDEVEASVPRSAIENYEAMLDALGRGDWDGDRDNWQATLDDVEWFPVTADQGQCTGRRCPNISNCSFFRARDGLQEAEVIVTNHDLVLSDLALGGGAILPAPEDSFYVFDEGHHLPDKALNHFAYFCRLPTTIAWVAETQRTLAKGAPLLALIPGLSSVLDPLPVLLDDIASTLGMAAEQAAQLFVESGDEREQLRFERGLVPIDLSETAVSLTGFWSRLVARLGTLEAGITDALEDEEFSAQRDELEAWQMALGGMLVRAEGVLSLWQDYAGQLPSEDPPRARWMRRRLDDDPLAIDLHCSHILAADILREQLWERAAGVLLTSATMTALGSFDRFRARSGVPTDSCFKVVVSPFDYSNASLCVPAMQSEPSDAPAHTQELIDLLPELLDAADGSLVLFSSRRQMNDVYDGLPADWRQRTLRQDDSSKQELLRRHRERLDAGDGNVIFGLASFAEGVDLPGRYCQHVVVAKLPFAVPDDPVDAALSDWLESQGRNAFMEISVPDAALRLVQASGRLLRTESDTGRVTLLDRRVVSRRYGRAILDSLPPFRRDIA
ncbi:MAG: ATP-dependent DNA helicase DinG [Congregibacter sp.]